MATLPLDEPPPPLPAPRRRSWFVRLVRFVLAAVLVFALGSILSVVVLRFVPPPITLTMVGDLIAGTGATRSWRSLDSIDPDMARAAIAGEDGQFCSHHGFDLEAMENAWRRNQDGGRIRGGSTISQQTAKNVFLIQGGGYVRKGLEAWFTLLIETIWGKRRIMEVYLNVAETGIGTYGVDAASQRYFGHDASRLSPMEAGRIAAVLPLPKRRAAIDPSGFVRRHGNAIARMVGVVQRDRLDDCLR